MSIECMVDSIAWLVNWCLASEHGLHGGLNRMVHSFWPKKTDGFWFHCLAGRKNSNPSRIHSRSAGLVGLILTEKNRCFLFWLWSASKQPILSELDCTSCLLGGPRQKPKAKSIGNSRSKQSEHNSKQISPGSPFSGVWSNLLWLEAIFSGLKRSPLVSYVWSNIFWLEV